MIAQLNQLWVKWTANHTIQEAQAMVTKHSDAFTVINFVNKGLVTPTPEAYKLLEALKTEIQ